MFDGFPGSPIEILFCTSRKRLFGLVVSLGVALNALPESFLGFGLGPQLGGRSRLTLRVPLARAAVRSRSRLLVVLWCCLHSRSWGLPFLCFLSLRFLDECLEPRPSSVAFGLVAVSFDDAFLGIGKLDIIPCMRRGTCLRFFREELAS